MYKSSYPWVDIPDLSLYTFLLGEEYTSSRGFDPDSVAFFDALVPQRRITRQELRERSLSLGWSIRNTLGAKLGDVAMIFSPNSLAWPVVAFGLIAAGLRTTTANASFKTAELANQLKDSGAGFVFAHPSVLPTVISALSSLDIGEGEAKHRVVLMPSEQGEDINTMRRDGWFILDDFIHQPGRMETEEPFSGEKTHQTVLLCYSSGTTGVGKGVETTHKNLLTTVATSKLTFPPLDPKKDSLFGYLPFYHIYGYVSFVLHGVCIGTPVAVLPAYSPATFCATIKRYQISFCFLAPPVLVALAFDPAIDPQSLTSVTKFLSGGAPLSGKLIKAVKARLGAAGVNCTIAQGYGMTEASPSICLLQAEDSVRKEGSCGVLMPNMEARLIDSEGRDVTEPGRPGEMWVRGTNIMKGYLRNAEGTKTTITEDGWLKTGDCLTRDSEGFFTVVDRIKELIKYNAFQVAPAELEAVLLQYPQIVDAGVIGVYSEAKATELPRAYVVIEHGAALMKTEEAKLTFGAEVQRWIEQRVAKHKYLRGGVYVVDAIPKSAAGKILRNQLREVAKKDAHIAEYPQTRL